MSVEYFPQLGYLVAIQDDKLHLLHDDLGDIESKFQFIFKQDSLRYFKHDIVNEMDEEIGDIKSKIIDRQRSITIDIEECLLDIEYQLQQLSLELASLDALISLGTIAIQHNLVKPEIVADPVVVVKGGRHMLQELTVDNFVPNDTFISSEKNIGLITGPNASGEFFIRILYTCVYEEFNAFITLTFMIPIRIHINT